jgi:hypothetical protein
MHEALERYVELYNSTECEYPTALRSDLLDINLNIPRLLHGALGYCTELEELAHPFEILDWYNGRPMLHTDEVRHNLVEELGDLLWFSCVCLQSVLHKTDQQAGLRNAIIVTMDQALITSAGLTTQYAEATRAGVVLLDYLKSLLFYNSAELKKYNVETVSKGLSKQTPDVPLQTLVMCMLQDTFELIAAVASSLGHGSLEDCVVEIAQKNLAKLQARHGGTAVSDTRDYDKEKQAMDQVSG